MTEYTNKLNKFIEYEPGILTGGLLEVIVKYSGDISYLENEYNLIIEFLNCQYALISGTPQNIAKLYDNPQIIYIELPKELSYELNSSLKSSCVTQVFRAPYNLDGEGTLFAVIDSGLDFTHPDFIDENGNTRIISVWDQTVNGNPPEGFSVGTEYTEEEINTALKSDNPFSVVPFYDYIGHGTAVSGVAVGNGRSSDGEEKGVAPKAKIVVVKLGVAGNEYSTRSNDIMRALRYVTNVAEKANLPLSVNLSYGTNNGGHNGQSLFEGFINDISSEWKSVISVAVGNEATSSHHYSATITQGTTTDVDITIINSREKMYLSVFKNFSDTMTFKIRAPDGETSTEMNSSQKDYSFFLDDVSVNVFFNDPSNYTASQEIFFLFKSNTDFLPDGLWQISVTGENIVDGKIDFWLPTSESVSSSTKFLTPDITTTLTIPSTAESVISVGGWDANNNTVATFSGRGFTLNDVYVKPDICAPAVSILTTKKGGGYDIYSGTSLASPFVAGASCIIMQWGIVQKNDIYLYGQKVKAYLQKGANRISTVKYPDRRWGYGTLCLEKTIELLKKYDL